MASTLLTAWRAGDHRAGSARFDRRGSTFTLRLPQQTTDPRKAGVLQISHF